MKPHYFSFDEFKEHSAEIARGLNNTKVSVLREAMVQAMGYKNVSAYKASFETIGCEEESHEFYEIDPNVWCYTEGDILFLQGRIDMEDPYTEPGRSIFIEKKDWDSFTQTEMEDWKRAVSYAWCDVDWLDVGEPFTIGSEYYVKAQMPIKGLVGFQYAQHIIPRFLCNQPGVPCALVVNLIFVGFLGFRDTHAADMSRIRTLCERAARVKAASSDQFELGLVTRDGEWLYKDMGDFLVCADLLFSDLFAGVELSDQEGEDLLRATVPEWQRQIAKELDTDPDNHYPSVWSWKGQDLGLLEKVVEWGIECAEMGLMAALHEMNPKAGAYTLEDAEAALEGKAAQWATIFFVLGVPARAEAKGIKTYGVMG